METAKLPLKLFESYFENVYEPAEDTFILLDALESDLKLIENLKPLFCLEIGCGSGTIITSLAKCLQRDNCLFLATDVNPLALKCSRDCWNHNLSEISSLQLIN
ncbi:hypothetical protein SSS_03180 [Sarcoptes scabiei]|nr:hypothetical protein SSS_03180 [Sarcoptes scabiei]